MRGKAPGGVVYLVHFTEPYRHARHYTGWTVDLDARRAEHRGGRGARLLQVSAQAGIGWRLARTWEGSRARERQLKRQGGASRRCPICTPSGRHGDERPRRPDRRPLRGASATRAAPGRASRKRSYSRHRGRLPDRLGAPLHPPRRRARGAERRQVAGGHRDARGVAPGMRSRDPESNRKPSATIVSPTLSGRWICVCEPSSRLATVLRMSASPKSDRTPRPPWRRKSPWFYFEPSGGTGGSPGVREPRKPRPNNWGGADRPTALTRLSAPLLLEALVLR